MNEKIWPNFFIVGAQKAGTTSLYEYLANVPGIYMSRIKEPHYFASNAMKRSIFKYEVHEKYYTGLFRNARDKLAVGEASTSYLWDVEAPIRIHQCIEDAKIIIILRNPIERAFSQYLMDVRLGWQNSKSFYEAIQNDYHQPKIFPSSRLYVEAGLYYQQVKRYLDTFGNENVKIIFFEEFIKKPEQEVKGVLKFLGIDSPLYHNKIGKIYNHYVATRSRWLTKIIRFAGDQLMRNHFTFEMLEMIPPDIKEIIRNRIIYKTIPKPFISSDARTLLEGLYYEDQVKLQSLVERSLPWSLVKLNSSENPPHQ